MLCAGRSLQKITSSLHVILTSGFGFYYAIKQNVNNVMGKVMNMDELVASLCSVYSCALFKHNVKQKGKDQGQAGVKQA